MPQPYKIEEVKKIKKRLENAKSIVLIDYKGINIEEVDELRNRMRNAGVDYFISKNTFIKIALNELGISELDSQLVGPTAIAVSINDEVAPARELMKFKKDLMNDKDFPVFKTGFITGNIMDVPNLEHLAELPSKEVLLAMILQGFNAPISGFVGVLQGILRKFVYTIDAVAKKQEEKK
ncbi:MAG: 50S ribosomal protein L10 [Candidatus Cloacimonetes bacterium]|nr:50S ribosomal protein L10 [Candidatus Cloacimonadota bacterium]